MLKWLLLIAVVVVAAVWIRKGKTKNNYVDPDHKEVEQSRFYVKNSHPEDRPADDQQNDRY